MVKKDRRKKEWQELTEQEKSIIKLLETRTAGEDEIKAIIDAIKSRAPPTQHFYDHSSDMKSKEGVILRLFHPGGGTSYALSYKSQKWAESLSGGEKPHIAGIGHYHKIEQLFYRNIHIFQTGTFEEQTPYMRRKNLAAMVGGWILRINDDEPIGVLGDTHIGSKYWRKDLLHDFYEQAIADGVTRFYHTGDIVSGENMFRGQAYELYAHGLNAQAEAVINEYPNFGTSIKTYYVLGNHDLSFWKRAGADISTIISVNRPDLICLGHEEADIKINNDEQVNTLETKLIPFY